MGMKGEATFVGENQVTDHSFLLILHPALVLVRVLASEHPKLG